MKGTRVCLLCRTLQIFIRLSHDGIASKLGLLITASCSFHPLARFLRPTFMPYVAETPNSLTLESPAWKTSHKHTSASVLTAYKQITCSALFLAMTLTYDARCYWLLTSRRFYGTLREYLVGQIKRGQCSFFRRSKARFREFWFLAGEITVHLRTLRSIKFKYFTPEGATKANDFLCSIF